MTNALMNRELLLFVAIVASAITLHVREHATDRYVPANASYARLCEPSAHGSDKTPLRAADCNVRAKPGAMRIARPWV